MAIQCPVCKAINETGPTCRRCKADLSILFQIEDRRNGLMADAKAALARDDTRTSLDRARAADGLRRDSESARLLACASLMRGDYPEALRLYSIADDSPSPAQVAPQ